MYAFALLTTNRRCERCNRSYRTPGALRQHVRDFPNHYNCPGCHLEADTWNELLEHRRKTGCRAVCQDCDDGRGMHYDFESDEYWDHVEEFNACTDCERHFISPSNLHEVGCKLNVFKIQCMLTICSMKYLIGNLHMRAMDVARCTRLTAAWYVFFIISI
jgi:hypothetical protein